MQSTASAGLPSWYGANLPGVVTADAPGISQASGHSRSVLLSPTDLVHMQQHAAAGGFPGMVPGIAVQGAGFQPWMQPFLSSLSHHGVYGGVPPPPPGTAAFPVVESLAHQMHPGIMLAHHHPWGVHMAAASSQPPQNMPFLAQG